jgi:uncharacterized protein YjbJ (UPF0337 family)
MCGKRKVPSDRKGDISTTEKSNGANFDYCHLGAAVRRWRRLLGAQARLLVETAAPLATFRAGWNARRRGTLFIHDPQTGASMDREHIKGAADKTKGAIKDAAGKVTGDKELQTEGKLDKAKGSLHNAAGDVKDAFRKAAEKDD